MLAGASKRIAGTLHPMGQAIPARRWERLQEDSPARPVVWRARSLETFGTLGSFAYGWSNYSIPQPISATLLEVDDAASQGGHAMACTALTINLGFFIPVTWSTAPNATSGGVTVALTTTGFAGVTVTGPGGSVFSPTLGSNTQKYMIFGSGPCVLLLQSGTGAGPVNRNVSLVDFTGGAPAITGLLLSTSTSAVIAEPVVKHSQGNGSAFLVSSNPGSGGLLNIAIRRSDNGNVLVPLGSATPDTSLDGEATATELRIHYKLGGPPVVRAIPQGECNVSPSTQNFPDVVVGGDVSLSTSADAFTIENTGSDCLTISAIGNVAPFTVTGFSSTELGPGETVVVNVTFTPGAVGIFNESLPVTRSPAQGDSDLTCQGEARAPVLGLSVTPWTLSFGSRPVGLPVTRNVTITNTGEAAIPIAWASSPPGSTVSWAASGAGTMLPYGGSLTVPITFTPAAETSYSATFVATSGAISDSAAITGSGCVANSTIVLPPVAPVDFGQVQRLFRTVRYFAVSNGGDGPLTFTARVQGPDATLFGLQLPSGSVTDVVSVRSYTVEPVSHCGPGAIGSGETIVAVAFHANGAPGARSAELVIEGHNATNATQTSWTYPLSAEIVALVAVDAALVLDRSGSMADPSGVRTKVDAEVSAGQLFAELARPDVEDRLAFIKFNTIPDAFQPITPVTSANQPSLANSINATELAPSGATGIAGGVLTGLSELATPRSTVPPVVNKAMVVLTDGRDNRAFQEPGTGDWFSLEGGEMERPGGGPVATQPLSTPSDVQIYALGIGNSENINAAKLNQLAQATGAFYGVVDELSGSSYFDLEKYFIQIYMDAVGMPVISDPVYTIFPGQTHEIEFDVLRGDVGFLVVVLDHNGFRLPFWVESPIGEVVDANFVPPGYRMRSGFTSSARYLEIGLPAGEPERYAPRNGKRWKLVVKHTGQVCLGDPEELAPTSDRPSEEGSTSWGFLPRKCREWDDPLDYGVAIGAASNFRLQAFVSPEPIHAGDRILLTAVVAEAGLPIKGCTVTVRSVAPSGATWTLTLLDDGLHSDGSVDDAEYAEHFTNTAEGGSYEFTFRAVGTSGDGEPVVREAVRAKYVVGRVPVDPKEPGGGDPGQTIRECCERLGRLATIGIGLVLLALAVLLVIVLIQS